MRCLHDWLALQKTMKKTESNFKKELDFVEKDVD
jgi:hypothetical protein